MREHRVVRAFVAAVLAIGATVAVVAPPSTVAALRTYVVTSTADTPWDGTPGVCSSAPAGGCTLRAALDLLAADYAVAAFDDVTIDLTGLGTGATITLQSPLTISAMITHRVELRGSLVPSERVELRGNGTFRLLTFDGGPSEQLHIVGLALHGGNAGDAEGGALRASGDITLRNVEVSGNIAGAAGGVFAAGWNLQVFDSAFSDNEATAGVGGALQVSFSTLRVERTSFTRNVAAQQGGAIWMQGRLNSAPNVSHSTFRGNVAGEGAGGSAVRCASCDPFNSNMVLDAVSVVDGGEVEGAAIDTDGSLHATNLTVTGQAGPAVRATGGSLTHTTITGNGGPAIVALGDESGELPRLSAASSILDGDCIGPRVVVGAGESVMAGAGCPTTGGGEVRTAPVSYVEAFGRDGAGIRTGDGSTLPVLLLASDHGLAPCRATVDARGWTRGQTCDHGAAQDGLLAPAATYAVDGTSDREDALTGDGVCADATGACTLRAAVMEGNAFPQTGVDTVQVPSGGYELARTLTITEALHVAGTGEGAPTIRSAGQVVRTTAPETVLSGLDLVGGDATFGGVVQAAVGDGDRLTVQDSRLSGGVAAVDGGGLNVVGSGGTVVLERVEISGNRAAGHGGGISIESDATLVADGLTLRDNQADLGGGISIWPTPPPPVDFRVATATITNSLIQGNRAARGGGLECLFCADVELRQVTLAGNSADLGGAVSYWAPPGESAGLRLVNSSILANTSAEGSAFEVRSDAPSQANVRLTHTTITGNTSEIADVPAGLAVFDANGTVTVANSIITGNNDATAAADCAGPITTVGAVFVGSGTCTVTAGPALDARDPALAPITDVPLLAGGGPFAVRSIPVAAPAITSPAVDAAPCSADVAHDVLGRVRPTGARCDAGSVEVYGLSLRMFPASAAPTAAGAGIPIADLPPSAVRPKAATGSTGGATVEGQDVRSIDLQASPIGRITLGDLPIGRIAADFDALARVPLSSIPIPGGWAPILEQTDFADIPLQNVTLGEVLALGLPAVDALRLDQLDLSSTPIGRIQLGSIAFANVPIGRITLPAGTDWCADIIEPSLPADGPACGPGAALDPADPDLTLFALGLQGVPIGRIPLGDTPIGRIALADTPIGRIAIADIDLAASPIGRIPIGRIDLVVDCALDDCATADLETAARAGASRPGATVADLGEYGGATLSALVAGGGLDDIPLAALGYFGAAVLADLAGDPALGASGADVATVPDIAAEVTLGDLVEWADFAAALGTWTLAELVAGLPADVLAELTLADLLLGAVDPADYPWEDLDLDAAADQLAADNGEVGFVVEIDSALEAAGAFQVSVALPTGFRYVPGSLTYDGVIESTTLEPDGTLSAVLQARSGTSRLGVSALVPLTVGAAGKATTTLTVSDAVGSLELTAASTDQVVSEAFEVNDSRDTATPIATDTLYLTHLATVGDQDWFSLPVNQGERLSLIVSNLTSDFDLTLFGPTAAPLRGTPDGSLAPAADGGRSLLAQGTVPGVAPADDIDLTAPSGTSLVAVSAHRGATDERIDTTPLEAGQYFVRVTGYQGASSTRPYALRASLTPSRFSGSCPAVDRTPGGPLPAVNTALPSGLTTLFVVDRARLAAVYPDGAADLLAQLDGLTTAVNGGPGDATDPFGTELAGVLDVSTLGGVQAAYGSWDDDPCNPAAANGVVTQIGAAIDNVVASHPTIAHVVLVGNDDQVPFARVRDATVYSNEREYATEVGDAQSPLTAALALGYLPSDDPYGDAHPVQVGPRELFAPTIAVGRLVETPTEIVAALGAYLESQGRLDPTTALSTGYDFLTDGAEAVARELEAANMSTDRLVTADWTAAELEADLDTGPDVASVNAHFDHYRALPADQDARGVQDELFTLADVDDGRDDDGDGEIDPGSTAAALQGTLLFSMGCHGGLSVSDTSVNGPHRADWAQTFTGIGAVFAGNSGYGYGDDTVVGATEDLMRRFAAGLDGTLSAGQAMALAKQQYLAAASVLTPFDEKVSAQVIFYGLPQFRLGSGTPQPPVDAPIAADRTTGLDATDVAVTGAVGTDLVPSPPGGARGVYYSYRGDVLASADQPVQPRAVVDLTHAGRELRGVLLTGLASTDVPLPDPVYFTPTVDLAATSPEVSPTTTSFPTSLQSVSHYQAPTGRRDQAVLVPGQFLGDPQSATGGGVQRLFTSMTGRGYYAPTTGPGADDVTAPLIARATAELDATAALSLRATVTDDSGDVRRVTVLFTNAAAPGTWTEVELVALGDGTYGADLRVPGVAAIDFFTQAVDAGGNVAVSSNKGTFFRSVPVAPPTITTTGPVGITGWYAGPVAVDVAPFATGPVDVTVNGTPTTTPLTLTDDGAYEVVATAPNGPSAREIVRIDTAAPAVSATTTPGSPAPGPVTVDLLGTDVGIGVTSITYSTTGAQTSGPTTVSGATASVPITTPGITVLTAQATDGLGRLGAATEVVISITPPPDRDTTAPDVTCTEGPTGWTNTDVTIDCQAADAESGLADPDQAAFTLATTVPAGTVTEHALTGGATVCDVAGNCTDVAPRGPFRIDQVAPTVAVTFPTANGTIVIGDDVLGEVGCADAGSGLASCTIGSIDTRTVGTRTVDARAVDSAGNVVTTTVTYRVVYDWSGFYLGVREPPRVNVVLRGLLYPISFTLLDADGGILHDRGAIDSIQSVPRSCSSPASFGTPVELLASAPGNLVDLWVAWLYVWQAPRQAGCYQIRVHLDDGTTHVADFRLL
jgi:hypothetical protein